MILKAIRHTLDVLEVAIIVNGVPSTERSFVIMFPDGTLEMVPSEIMLLFFKLEEEEPANCYACGAAPETKGPFPNLLVSSPGSASSSPVQPGSFPESASSSQSASEAKDRPPLKRCVKPAPKRPPSAPRKEMLVEFENNNAVDGKIVETAAPVVDRTGIAAAIREALLASSPSTIEDIAKRVTAKHKHIRADQVKGNLHPMRTAGEIEIDPQTRGLGPGIKWRFTAPKDAST